MDTRYEAYCMADPVFYDSPAAASSVVSPIGHGEFDQTIGDVPQDWARGELNEWIYLRPAITDLPNQGWKVHVSATVDNAQDVLDVVTRYCTEHAVPFKFLASRRVLMARNSKYAERGGSGKFVTIYPTENVVLEQILQELGELLDGQPGPYILSDLRWRNGPLYVRYGGFRLRLCKADNGDLVAGIETPDGVLVPDVRGPSYETPPWVPTPPILIDALAARAGDGSEEFPYKIVEALHFSNGGGVYRAEDPRTGKTVLVKEARPMAGLDREGADSVSRLRRERDILRQLEGVEAVPQLLDYFTCWEHEFLVREHAEGEILIRHMVRRHPLLRPDATDEAVATYADWVLGVLGRVEAGVDAMHERGVVFGDLHPGNIIVDIDGEVRFIDFEVAAPVEHATRTTLGAAGYTAPPDYTGFAIDRYALGCLRLALFTSLAPVIPWDPGKIDQFLDVATDRFPLPDDYRAKVWRDLGPRPFRDRPGIAVPEQFGPGLNKPVWPSNAVPEWPALRDSMTAAILASATPQRTDRLFPGDINQFAPGGGVNFAYGAAGVLWALAETGTTPPAEHVDWLVEATRKADRTTPGFFHGLGGIALALDRIGRPDEAREVLDRARALPLDGVGTSLADGLPGLGLAVLHFAQQTGDRALLAEAGDLAARIVDELRDTPDAAIRPGLLKGASGSALFMIRLAEATGDQELLDQAEKALRRDLDGCVWTEDRTVQANEGWRIVPYLATGSTGVGLVLHEFLRHRPAEDLREYATGIRRAAEPEFVVQSGLLNGRAGLVSYLLHTDDGSPAVAATIERHLRGLGWHAAPLDGRVAFIGDQLMRLSMDLATGSAGVLVVLAAALDGRRPVLPFAGSQGERPRSDDHEGGE